jgi:hypothetical protein
VREAVLARVLGKGVPPVRIDPARLQKISRAHRVPLVKEDVPEERGELIRLVPATPLRR